MKVCPKCNQTYADNDLNFCLNDGEFLTDFGKDDAPPTIFMDPVRTTNPNTWQQPPVTEPITVRQNQPNNLQNPQTFSPPSQFYKSQDQTLPTISLVLGVLSLLLVCCYGGFPLGLAALITGYLGMKNADNNPMQYGGRGLAIGGLVLGIMSLLSSIVFLFFVIFAK